MKDFQHRKCWFLVFRHMKPNWKGSGFILHVAKIWPSMDTKIHYYYVQKDDSLWSITLEDLFKYRDMYNGRWHIDRDYLTPEVITPEWREQINNYQYVKTIL